MNFTGLPQSCPPTPHDVHELTDVWRILAATAASPYDWQSHQQRGKPVPAGADACKWSSMSLTRNPKAALSLRNLAHLSHAAKLAIPAGAGAHKSKKSHVDFWPAAGTDISQFVVAVEEV